MVISSPWPGRSPSGADIRGSSTKRKRAFQVEPLEDRVAPASFGSFTVGFLTIDVSGSSLGEVHITASQPAAVSDGSIIVQGLHIEYRDMRLVINDNVIQLG